MILTSGRFRARSGPGPGGLTMMVLAFMAWLLFEPSSATEVHNACSFDADLDLLSCSLRTLNAHNQTSLASSAKARRIRIHCSDVFFYESFLRTNHFGYLPNLQSLDLDSCKIRRVPALAFSGLSDLKSLTLRSRNTEWPAMIMELEGEDAFTGLESLRHLNLTQNNIWTLPPESLCGLQSLTSLNLSHNFMQDLGDLGFGPVKNGLCRLPLRQLDLSSNSFTMIPPEAFMQISSLEELNLEQNLIDVVEDNALSNLNRLKKLNLANNQLVALPPTLFSESLLLEELYLHNNSLTSLAPGLFSSLDRLLVLNLSRNALTNDWLNGDTFTSLHRLVALDLSHNELDKLDQSLFAGLNQLQILSLRHNRIHTVGPHTFADQLNLHILYLSHNRIETLHPRSLQGMPTLSSLSLNNNRLRSLHRNTLRNCTGLRDLSINANKLSEVSRAIRVLSQLNTLDLGENNIAHLKNESFKGLSNLYGLRLASNGLKELHGVVFDSVPTLHVLNLADNGIEKMSATIFKKLTKLRVLRLDGNRLEDLNGLLTTQNELRWLNISANNLQWFDYGLISKSVRWLDLHSNNLEDLGNYYKLNEGYSLQSLDASNNRIANLTSMSLLKSIEYLRLNNNQIRYVEPGTFEGKEKLKHVELTHNRIEKLSLSALSLRKNPAVDNKITGKELRER